MKYYELNVKASEDRLADAEKAWAAYDENFSEYAAGCAKMSHDEYIIDYMERLARDDQAKQEFAALVESFPYFNDFFSLVESRVSNGEDELDIVRSFDKLHDEIRRQARDGEIGFSFPEVDKVARYVRKVIIAIARGRFSPSASDSPAVPASSVSSRHLEKSSPSEAFAAAAIASQEANAFEQHMIDHDDDGVVYCSQAKKSATGKKQTVRYSGGESRFQYGKSVDYMQVSVCHEDEDYRLYAEIAPADLEDENGNPAILDGNFNPAVKDPEWLSFPYLKAAILDLCKQIGFDPSALDFDMGDDMPTFRMPYTQADSRID